MAMMIQKMLFFKKVAFKEGLRGHCREQIF